MDRKIGQNHSDSTLVSKRMVVLEVVEKKTQDGLIQLGYYVGPKSMSLYERIGSASQHNAVYVYKNFQTQSCEIYVDGGDNFQKIVDESGKCEKISKEEFEQGIKSLKEKGYSRLGVVGVFLRGYG